MPQHCQAYNLLLHSMHVTSCSPIILRAMAKFVMLQHVSLCHGKKQHTTAFCATVLCSTARNNACSMTLCPWCHLLCHGCKDEKTINLCSIGCHSGVVAFILALLVVVFFVEAVALLFSLREKTINLFGFGGLGGVVVVVFGGIFDFAFFCSSIVHSSAAFCGIIFVPQHCFMCHGIALCAAAFFVPWQFLCAAATYCAAAICFVLWQCD